MPVYADEAVSDETEIELQPIQEDLSSGTIQEPELKDTDVYQISEEDEDIQLMGEEDTAQSYSYNQNSTETELLLTVSEQIKEALLNGETSISLASFPLTSDNEQFKHIGFYCPYLDGTNIYVGLYTYTDGSYAKLEITNSLSTAETKAWIEKIDAKISELQALIDDSSFSVADQALILHDYMDAHYHYDTALEDEAYYPAILLTEHKGVCQAYSYLFQYLMNRKGIECYTTSSDSMKHAWNILKIGSNYYHIDITWDDVVPDNFGQAKHNCFLLSDSAIQSKSSPYSGWDLTEYACNDSSYEDDYFVSALSPVIFDGSDRYYINKEGLAKYSAGNVTLIDQLDDWKVYDQPEYYYSDVRYSGLFEYNDVLYYNAYNAILTYDLTNGKSATFSNIDTANGYVFGILNEGSTLEYAIQTKPGIDYSSKDIRTLDMTYSHVHSYTHYVYNNDATYDADGTETAVCDNGCGETDTRTVSGTKKEYLATPALGTVENVVGGVKVTWGAVSGAEKYVVYYKTAGAKWSKAGMTTETSFKVTGLAFNTRYYFTVKCVADDGRTATSKYDTAGKSVTYLANIKPTVANTSTGITLKWSKVSGATGYYIYRKTGSGSYSKIKTITSASTVSYTDTAVKSKNGTVYTYVVKAYKGNTGGKFTAVSICRLTGVSFSSAANSTSKTVTLKWSKNTKATGYQIQCSTSKTFASGNQSATVKGASSASVMLKNLTKGKTYYMRIRVYKTVGKVNYYSAWSSVKTVKVTK